MPVSEAKKAANKKWDKANMVTVGCKITRKQSDQLKSACQKLGITQNYVFRTAVQRTIQEAGLSGEGE